MKYLILLLFTINCYAQVTFQQAKQVFNQLQKVTNYHVVLKYSKDLDSNATTTYECIIINQGMLNDCSTGDELAMVLGHELGHWALKYSNQNNETNADKLGYTYCKKLGLRNCLDFFKIMKTKYGDEGDEEHPPWSKRLEDLK